MRFFIWCLLSSLFYTTYAQNSVASYVETRRSIFLKEYIDFLKLPNTLNDPEMLRQNAEKVMELMDQAGIKNIQLLEGMNKETIPAVYGEVLNPKAKKTLLFYAHYDGQPVNPDKWAEGLSPFVPQLVSDRLDRGGKFIDLPEENDKIENKMRLYARSAADDKAGVFAIIKAYQIIKDLGLTPEINLKFFFEGEEEKGSTNLADILKKHKQKLQGDLWVICDGPTHMSGERTISFGVRGDVNLNMTVFGPARPLHSGNYGNWAPNPALKLVELLASMKNKDGFVTVKGFYDDVIPLSNTEKKAIKAIPPTSEAMRKELLFAQVEIPSISYYEAIAALPTLNINGIVSANVGKLASNIIPTSASATLDLRLVKGNDLKRQINKVIDHIKAQGYFISRSEPTDSQRLTYPNIVYIKEGDGYNAQRTPMNLPIAQDIINTLKAKTGKTPILIPSSGGSLPLYIFEKELGTPPITIPIVNYDNNQHGENENLRLGHLFEGIQTMTWVMLMR